MHAKSKMTWQHPTRQAMTEEEADKYWSLSPADRIMYNATLKLYGKEEALKVMTAALARKKRLSEIVSLEQHNFVPNKHETSKPEMYRLCDKCNKSYFTTIHLIKY